MPRLILIGLLGLAWHVCRLLTPPNWRMPHKILEELNGVFNVSGQVVSGQVLTSCSFLLMRPMRYYGNEGQ